MNQHSGLQSPVDTAGLAKWQFGLPHLFGLMTWCALAAWLIRVDGPGTLVMTGGLLLAWLNCRGAFGRLQLGRMQGAVVWAAWGLFLISHWLPCMPPIFGTGAGIPGYSAAWYALSAPIEALTKGGFLQTAVLWLLLMDLANVLGFLLPALCWRRWLAPGGTLTAVLCMAIVSVWSVAWSGEMLYGYYVWCGSFCLALVAVPIRWRTLAAMVGVGLVLGWLLRSDRIML